MGLWVAVVIAVAVLGVMLYANASSDCNAKGGALVRGAVGYVCVAAAH